MSDQGDAVAREKAIARANLAKVVTLQKEKRALEKELKELKEKGGSSEGDGNGNGDAGAAGGTIAALKAQAEDALKVASERASEITALRDALKALEHRCTEAEHAAAGVANAANARDEAAQRIAELESQLESAATALAASQEEASRFEKQAKAAADEAALDAADAAAAEAASAADARASRALEQAHAAHAAELEQARAQHEAERAELVRAQTELEGKLNAAEVAASLDRAAAVGSADAAEQVSALQAEAAKAQERLDEMEHQLRTTKEALGASQKEVASMARAATSAAAASEEVEEAERRGAEALDAARVKHEAELARLLAAHSVEQDEMLEAQQASDEKLRTAEAAAEAAQAEVESMRAKLGQKEMKLADVSDQLKVLQRKAKADAMEVGAAAAESAAKVEVEAAKAEAEAAKAEAEAAKAEAEAAKAEAAEVVAAANEREVKLSELAEQVKALQKAKFEAKEEVRAEKEKRRAAEKAVKAADEKLAAGAVSAPNASGDADPTLPPTPDPPSSAPSEAASSTPAFAVGSCVLVPRSGGGESIAFVRSFDAAQKIYTVELDSIGSGKVKQANESMLTHAAEPSPPLDLTESTDQERDRTHWEEKGEQEEPGRERRPSTDSAGSEVGAAVALGDEGSSPSLIKRMSYGSADEMPDWLQEAQEDLSKPPPAQSSSSHRFAVDDIVMFEGGVAQVVGVNHPHYAIRCDDGADRTVLSERLTFIGGGGGEGDVDVPQPAPPNATQPSKGESSSASAPPPAGALPRPGARQSLPPAAYESLRNPRSRRSGGFLGLFGAEEKTEGLDTSLPKHLEAQGLEIGRLGQLVRQLAGEAKYEEALGAAQRRLTLAEQTYGVEHILTATCLNDVATFLQAFARFEESREMFERASKLQRKLLGDTHPHSIATLNNLVSLYGAMGDTGKKEAMEFLVQALQATAAKQG